MTVSMPLAVWTAPPLTADRDKNQFTASGNNHLYINGGYIYVDAGGDGLDSNGAIDMTAGTVIVNGPSNTGNGPWTITGLRLPADIW